MNHSDHKIIRHFGVRQHGKFVFWQPILATTNLLSYKLENLFLIPDPTVNMAISELYTEDLFSTTTHSHLPSPSYNTIFPDGAAGFSFLLSKASRQKYVRLCRNHTHFHFVHPTNFRYKYWYWYWIKIALHYVSAITTRLVGLFKAYWKALNSLHIIESQIGNLVYKNKYIFFKTQCFHRSNNSPLQYFPLLKHGGI